MIDPRCWRFGAVTGDDRFRALTGRPFPAAHFRFWTRTGRYLQSLVTPELAAGEARHGLHKLACPRRLSFTFSPVSFVT